MYAAKSDVRSDTNRAGADRLRVLLVDDSAVIRGMVTRWLLEAGNIEIVGAVSDGEQAVLKAAAEKPDVVVLDIEMPRMDGMTALPKILEKSPDTKVIMSSTLTQRNADISLRALNIGAADYIAKPTARAELHAEGGYKQELVNKVTVLGEARRMRPRGAMSVQSASPRHDGVRARPEGGLYGRAPIVLRKSALIPPAVIAIGSSTGGPQALMSLLKVLRPEVKQPILITQHMPATFTTILAQHLTKATDWPSTEATDGETIVAGRAYIAPGDHHMTVAPGGAFGTLHLNQDAQENFCRPAVDPFFRSLAKTHGQKVLGVILTGMGHDGLSGGHAVVEAGGTIIAQDEATSVVWGMPGAVATGGLCSAVLSLNDLAPAIVKLSRGQAL